MWVRTLTYFGTGGSGFLDRDIQCITCRILILPMDVCGNYEEHIDTTVFHHDIFPELLDKRTRDYLLLLHEEGKNDKVINHGKTGASPYLRKIVIITCQSH